MITRTIIYADNGKVLTNGETYGKEILLAIGTTAEGFYEITDAEYKKIEEAKESQYGIFN